MSCWHIAPSGRDFLSWMDDEDLTVYRFAYPHWTRLLTPSHCSLAKSLQGDQCQYPIRRRCWSLMGALVQKPKFRRTMRNVATVALIHPSHSVDFTFLFQCLICLCFNAPYLLRAWQCRFRTLYLLVNVLSMSFGFGQVVLGLSMIEKRTESFEDCTVESIFRFFFAKSYWYVFRSVVRRLGLRPAFH